MGGIITPEGESNAEQGPSQQNGRLAPESVDSEDERNEEREPDIEDPIVPKAEILGD
jgi:hypothetical protein